MMVAEANWTVEDKIKEKRKEMLDILARIPRSSRKGKEQLRVELARIGAEVKTLKAHIDVGGG